MSYIAFISSFPTEANMRDGYFRRVHYVDQAFQDSERIHLDIRFGKNFRKKTVTRDLAMQVMHLNAILHFFLIGSVLRKSGIIYIHSIAKIPSILLHLIHLKKRVPFVVDLHGVMVEELKLSGKYFSAFLYTWIEKFCFRNCDLNIYVSEVMQSHFCSRYPNHPGEDLIFATNSQQTQPSHPLHQPQPSKPDEVLFLYSGNCQKWQNVDLMLDAMLGMSNPCFKFLILSGQKKRFEEKIRRRKIPSGKITVISVKPEELESYYELAHYGFILRDDILVNRVANPTKLAEYLQYGIIPVVKLVDIGDYALYDYEYILYGELNNGLLPRKSQKNRDIYHEISRRYGCGPLQAAISRIQKRYISSNMA